MPSASAITVAIGLWSSIAGRVRSFSSAFDDTFMPPIRIAQTWPSASNTGMVIANIGVPLVRLTPTRDTTLRRSRTVRRR